MHTKSTQMKGYSYHFSRSILAHSPSNRLIQSNDAITQITNNTIPTNHRYQSQDDLHDPNPTLSRKEVHSHTSRQSRDKKRNKNYQYSILPLEFKNHRNPEFFRDCQEGSLHYEESSARARSSGEFYTRNDTGEHHKKPVNTKEQNDLESQLRKEKEKRQLIERSFDILKLEHIKLLQKIKNLEEEITEKNNQLNILKQMGYSSEKPKDNLDKMLLGSQRAETSTILRIQSNLFNYLVQNLENSFEKDNSKQLSRSTITCSYQDEYRQILSIFSIQFNEDNFHEHLLKDIKKMMKRNDDYDKLITVFKERQKEMSKVAHIIRKLQGQNSQLSQMVQYLNEQQQKIVLTLSETIREKQEMHLSLLNKKYAQLEEEMN